ncbi:hypothetical protein QOZ80_4BG0352800 [Eleusine coracana subsp. coracana]|nr:hypothetical protein QOZ80_4BG0352800 [Eleusine coracana subsp. coracana]
MSPFSYLVVLTLALASASAIASATTGNAGTYVAGPPKTMTLSAREQFLQGHNAARAKVGLPPLVWNATLQLDARRYATELRTRCSTDPLQAWGTEGVYGRNLFKSEGFGSAAEAVASWVGEGRWYDAHTGECSAPEGKTCAHYKQVVSRATTQLGCLRRMCVFSDDTVAVCVYYPPRNVNGEQRPY